MISLLQFIGILLLIPVIITTFVCFVTMIAVKLLGTLKTKTVVLMMMVIGAVGVSMIVFG